MKQKCVFLWYMYNIMDLRIPAMTFMTHMDNFL